MAAEFHAAGQRLDRHLLAFAPVSPPAIPTRQSVQREIASVEPILGLPGDRHELHQPAGNQYIPPLQPRRIAVHVVGEDALPQRASIRLPGHLSPSLRSQRRTVRIPCHRVPVLVVHSRTSTPAHGPNGRSSTRNGATSPAPPSITRNIDHPTSKMPESPQLTT
jgi:hypothetical protein